MDYSRDRGGHHKRRDNDGDALHRRRRKLDTDDASTVVGICVSFLVMTTGVLVSIVCVDLLTELLHIGLRLQTP